MKFEYPEPLELTVGCKVCWRLYGSESDAKIAAEVAIREQSYFGVDTGYLEAGEIKITSRGLYEVVCP